MTRSHKILPFSRWPLSDQHAWYLSIRVGDIFEDRGPGSHWSDGSKKTILYGYARWLGFIKTAEPDALDLAPEKRVTPERVLRYVELLQGSISPAGTQNYVKHLNFATRVMAPGEDWRWLHELALRLEKLVTPRNKRPRMVSSHELVDLGLKLMADAEDATEAPDIKDIERAILYRDGLMIALLASRPIRRRNLAGIRIGVNLLIDPTGYRLRFAEHETKTHTVLEHPLPDWLVPYTNCYLEYYRLIFPGAVDHDGLWASVKGGPLRSEGIYDRIILRTKEAFGHSVNPHLFRDCVATTIAHEDPEHVHIAADLLGHASLEFTQRHYIQSQTREACVTYQGTLEVIRHSLKQNDQGRRD
jgi:integrase/recombinase XerD